MTAFTKSAKAALDDHDAQSISEEMIMEEVHQLRKLLAQEDLQKVSFELMTTPLSAEVLKRSMGFLQRPAHWFAIIRNFTLDADALWVIYREVCFGRMSKKPQILHHLLDHPALDEETYDRLLAMTITSETSRPTLDTCAAFLISRHAEHGGARTVLQTIVEGRFIFNDSPLLAGRPDPADLSRLVVPEPMLSKKMIDHLWNVSTTDPQQKLRQLLVRHPNMDAQTRLKALGDPETWDEVIWAILSCERLSPEEFDFVQRKVKDDVHFRRRHGFALALSSMNNDKQLLDLCGLFRVDLMSHPDTKKTTRQFFGTVLSRENASAEVFNNAYAAMLELSAYTACANYFEDPRLSDTLRHSTLSWHVRNRKSFPSSWFQLSSLTDAEIDLLADSVQVRNPSEQMAILKSLKPSSSTLRILRRISSSPHFDIREQVAGHPGADSEILFTLSQDSEEQVRSIVAQNSKIPVNAQRFLAHDRAYGVRKLLLKNPGIDSDTVFLLVHDGNHHIRRLVLSHPLMSPNLVTMLTKDVRDEVAQEARAVLARRWPRGA